MFWIEFLEHDNVVNFILLFFRMAALFITLHIFSHEGIPITVKAALALFFTIFFYPEVPPLILNVDIATLALAALSEFLFGLFIGMVLQIAFHAITFAGGQISFNMGFSMASAIDPQTGVSMPIISQFLSLIALMVLFSLDMHHWILLFSSSSIANIPLGGFMTTQNMFDYTLVASANMFVVGFMIAFPITALSLLADIIFGMLMKTMPQFNLLVIGFPIKIAVAFLVLMATLASTMYILSNNMQEAFNFLEMLF